MTTKTEKSLTTIGVKEINRRLVLGALYTKEGVTKLQLVNSLEMSLSTVDQNLKELNKQGFIEELGFCGSTGGRKAKLLHLKPRLKIAVGIFILKKVVHIRALDLYGKKIAAESFALDYAKDEVYLQKLSHKFQHFLHKACILKEDLLTVRVSVQGLVDPQDEVVSYGMLLDNSGFNAKDLSVAFDCEVKLCHDSYAAAYFETYHTKDLQDALMLLLNRNFGGALIINGEVLKGLYGRSGVIEHYCVDEKGPLCYCGCRGCLERYCSALVLTEKSGLSLDDFFKGLREGKAKLQSIWQEYLTFLAKASRNFLSLVDGKLLLSGLLTPYLKEEDLKFLLEKINENFPFKLQREQLIIGTFGDETAALGAALISLETFLKENIIS